MILKKFKAHFSNSYWFQQETLNQLQELEWANIYHDSIRGIDFLEKLPLNIGRWAGNYSFFYVLNRILKDAKPTSILELGLGESSKFISTYLDNYLLSSIHTIIEQNETWQQNFNNSFKLSKRSCVHHLPLIKKNINSFEVNCYKNFKKEINSKFDFYIIDGPTGSHRFSRYDVIHLINQLTSVDNFILLLDDFNRKGEQDTTKKIIDTLKSKNINFYQNIFKGNKKQLLIVTSKYQFLTTI